MRASSGKLVHSKPQATEEFKVLVGLFIDFQSTGGEETNYAFSCAALAQLSSSRDHDYRT